MCACLRRLSYHIFLGPSPEKALMQRFSMLTGFCLFVDQGKVVLDFALRTSFFGVLPTLPTCYS